MKKTFALILAALLALSLSACSDGAADPTPTQGGSIPTPEGTQGTETPQPEGRSKYVFTYGEVRLPMNEEFSALREALGEPTTYFEAQSCAFDGLDKTFTYPGIELVTYPVEGVDYISDIYFLDESVSTAEGLHIGSTLEEVEAAYGTDHTADDFGFYYTYTDGDTQLKFGVEDGVVTEIEYLALNNLLD